MNKKKPVSLSNKRLFNYAHDFLVKYDMLDEIGNSIVVEFVDYVCKRRRPDLYPELIIDKQ